MTLSSLYTYQLIVIGYIVHACMALGEYTVERVHARGTGGSECPIPRRTFIIMLTSVSRWRITSKACYTAHHKTYPMEAAWTITAIQG